jgi:hypothetical protein
VSVRFPPLPVGVDLSRQGGQAPDRTSVAGAGGDEEGQELGRQFGRHGVPSASPVIGSYKSTSGSSEAEPRPLPTTSMMVRACGPPEATTLEGCFSSPSACAARPCAVLWPQRHRPRRIRPVGAPGGGRWRYGRSMPDSTPGRCAGAGGVPARRCPASAAPGIAGLALIGAAPRWLRPVIANHRRRSHCTAAERRVRTPNCGPDPGLSLDL